MRTSLDARRVRIAVECARQIYGMAQLLLASGVIDDATHAPALRSALLRMVDVARTIPQVFDPTDDDIDSMWEIVLGEAEEFDEAEEPA